MDLMTRLGQIEQTDKARQKRRDAEDAQWAQFQNDNHKTAFYKWAQKNYGERDWYGKNNGYRKPNYSEWLNAKKLFDINFDRTQRGLKAYDFGNDLSIDPSDLTDEYLQYHSDYVKKHGVPAAMADVVKYATPLRYKGQYENTVEDKYNQANGLPPLSVQVLQKAWQEKQNFDGNTADAKTTAENYEKWFPTLSALTRYAQSQEKDKQDADAKARAQWEKEHPDVPYVPPAPPEDFSSILGTKPTKAAPFDMDALKALGYDEKTGFQALRDSIGQPIINQQQAENDARYNAQPTPDSRVAAAKPRPIGPAQGAIAGALGAMPRPRPLPVMTNATLPVGAPLSAQGRQTAQGITQQTMGATIAPANGSLGWSGDAASGLVSTHVDSKNKALGSGQYVIQPLQNGQFQLVYQEDGKTLADALAKNPDTFGSLQDAQKAASSYAAALTQGKTPTSSIGKLASAFGGGAWRGLQLPQSAYMNAGNVIHNIANGNAPFEGAKLSMTLGDFSKRMSEIYGGPDIMADLEKSGLLGVLAGQTLEILSDPTQYGAGGVIHDLMAAKGVLTPANLALVKNTFMLDQNALKKLAPTAKESVFARGGVDFEGNPVVAGTKNAKRVEPLVGKAFPTLERASTVGRGFHGEEWRMQADPTTGGIYSESADGQFVIRPSNGKFNLYENTVEDGMQLPKFRGGYNTLDEAKGAVGNATNARQMVKNLQTSPQPIGRATVNPRPSIGNVSSERPQAIVGAAKEPQTRYSALAVEREGPNGVSLTQNMPTTGGANPAFPPAQRFETSKPRLTLRDRLNQAIQSTLDPQQGVKRLGDNQATYRGAINSKNVGTQVANIMERELVGMDGKRLGDSVRKMLLDNVPKDNELEFWEYALQKHNIARANEGKPIFSQVINGKDVYFSSTESAARVAQLDALHPDWSARAKNISGWIDTFMREWGVKAGTVDADAYKVLRQTYADYLPSNRAFSDLEDFIPGNGAVRGFTDQSSPVRTATGSTRNILDPAENIINLVNRTVRTARLNEVGQLFVNAIKANPRGMSKLAEIVPEAVGNVDNVMRVLVRGKPVYVKINDIGVLNTLTKLGEIKDVGQFANAIGKITGFMKAAITTNNPIFGILNGMKDMPTYLILSRRNPISALGNYARAGAELVAQDMINPVLRKIPKAKEIQTPMLNQFRGLGGEGSTLTGRGTYETAQKLLGRKAVLNKAGEIERFKPTARVARAARWIGREFQKFNTAIEITPRYATFLNSLKKKKSLEEALYDAAEITTNFSRGGGVLKEADRYVLYLNASVQGLARLARAVNPLKPRQFISTLIKGGIAITLPQAILTEVNKNNPNYQQVDNRTKDAYFLVPNMNDLDENGNPKTFTKIPRSRELGYLFGAFYDRVYRASMGDKGAWKGFAQSGMTNFMPADPVSNNILTPITNLAANKDVFGRAIVPQYMQARSPHLQYDEKTTEPSKWIADALFDVAGIEVSPKQMDYLADAYLGVISDIGIPATTKGGDVKGVLLRRFTADPLYSNRSITDFYDEMDRLNTLATDKNFREDIEGEVTTDEERMYSVMTKASRDMSDLSKQAQDQPDQTDTRKYMIAIAQNALNTTKSGIPYIAPIKVALKKSDGTNKRDENGQTLYRYLSMDEYKAYQSRLDKAYKDYIGSSYYKMLAIQQRPKALKKHMESVTSGLYNLLAKNSLY